MCYKRVALLQQMLLVFVAFAAAVQHFHHLRRFHQQLFALQDRSTPRCFDKNLVIQARAEAPVAAGGIR